MACGKIVDIRHTEDGTPVFIEQSGNGTAVAIVQHKDNPALRLVAEGNAAAIEIEQVNGKDAISCPMGDVRARQLIATLHVAIYNDGAICFQDTKGKWVEAIKFDPQGRLWINAPGGVFVGGRRIS